MKLSLCIPMYNESRILPDTLRKVSEYAAKVYDGDCEVVFADDGSTDSSADIVRNFGDPLRHGAAGQDDEGRRPVFRFRLAGLRGAVRWAQPVHQHDPQASRHAESLGRFPDWLGSGGDDAGLRWRNLMRHRGETAFISRSSD